MGESLQFHSVPDNVLFLAVSTCTPESTVYSTTRILCVGRDLRSADNYHASACRHFGLIHAPTYYAVW